MSIGFANTLGLLGLLSLIPFIIIYLIRPKPKEIVIPSLIFLSGSKEYRSKSGFLRRLFNDKLLLLQIIILALISLFFSAPFITSAKISEGDVFLVLDTSASVDDIRVVKEHALSNLGTRNTIITVGSNPYLILDSGDMGDAKETIYNLEISGTRSAIADSLIAARGFAEKISGERSIVVVSDFIETEEGDVEKEMDTIRSKGIPLKTINVARGKDNVGIIGMNLRKSESDVLIKNFCCGEKEFTLDYDGEEVLTLEEGESIPYSFQTKSGRSVLTIDVDDNIRGDNEVYIVNEINEKAEVLLISDGNTKYLEAVMEASDSINYDIRSPTNAKDGYDVYILKDIGTLNSKLVGLLKDELKKGKSVVVIPEEGINGDYSGLLNFEIGNNIGGGDSSLVGDASFVDGLDFGRQGSVRKVDCGECSGVYVKAGEIPIIMVVPSGSGLIGYYGLNEEDGGFQNRPDYPIFWTRFLRHLAGVRDLNGMNLKTGSSLSFDEEVKFDTPTSSGKDKTIILDGIGFYEINGKTYSANLLSEEESNLDDISVESGEDGSKGLGGNDILKKEIWKWLMIIAIFLLLVEWVLINRKIRRREYNV